MSMNPDPQGQQRPGLFARIGNFFGEGDPNAGTPTDPFANLSRAQRTMLGFAALRDAAASLEGRDSNYFSQALGGFEQAQERERLRAQGEFANRNQALQNLIQLRAMAEMIPDDPGLQSLIATQEQLLMGGAGLGGVQPAVAPGGGVTPTRVGGGMPSPGDFTGGVVPQGLPSGPQGVTGAPRTGVVYDDAGTVQPQTYTGEQEVVPPAPAPAAPSAPAPAPAPAPSDPLAAIDAQIAEQERTINAIIGNLPGQREVSLGQLANMDIGVDPQTQANLDLALQRRRDLMAERQALAEAAPAREAAARENEDAARQARFYSDITGRLLQNPNLSGVVGRFEGTIDPESALSRLAYNEGEREALAIVAQLQGANFLQARDQLRGTGTITDFESRVATNAMSRLSERGVSEQAYRQALTEVQRVFENAEARAMGRPVPHPDIAEERQSGDLVTLPDGTQVRIRVRD